MVTFQHIMQAAHDTVSRLPLLVALMGSALVAGTVPAGAAQAGTDLARVLVPLLTLAGARLVPAADRTGTPLPFSGAAPFTPFIHPVAAAMSGNDVYIADSGAGRVLRFDLATNVMAAVHSAPVAPGIRFVVGSDFSLYVLDKPRSRVLKLGRNGELLATYSDSQNLVQPTAIAIDDARGEVLVADQLYRHIVAFHPLGGASRVIYPRGDERNRVLSITAIALGRDAIHISDPLCRCVAVIARDGAVRATYGHHEIGQPGAIAIDRHDRVFVADAFDRSVKVFAAGRLIDDVPALALGIREISDLTVYESRLVIADGAGARVAVLRIAPRRQGE